MTPPVSTELLERLYRSHHHLENLAPDPLVYARGFADPEEGEVAGLLAAAFAYGQVGKILEALGRVFAALGPRPLMAVRTADLREISTALEGFTYRFHKMQDVVLFVHLLRQALDRWGTLSALFAAGDAAPEMGPALTAFADAVLSGDARPVLRTRAVPLKHPVRFFLASPARGGAAKRLCLFLRWMVRRDAIDPGYWQGRIDPARLVVPLDTHVARVAAQLGLSKRKTADWRTAVEITETLRRHDPIDPVRYDFSLFRHGMDASRRKKTANGS
ncbi:MAG: TIGR02757 family protein [Deltaproteobacteria bacterium]|nr:TIGR02757 family protein [Deltaproteobacteria bacterium]